MQHPLCATCGSQFPASDELPSSCPVCDDERQYVAPGGQRWTTLEALRRAHRNAWQRLEPELYGIGSEPRFAIGQRALLVRTPGGNGDSGLVCDIREGAARAHARRQRALGLRRPDR